MQACELCLIATLIFVQFLYDMSQVGKPMRSWLCVQLGTWHPYKQANQVVWQHWGPRVFAPLFHEVISDANFNKKARLATIACFLTYVRLAYPSFKAQLFQAYDQVKRLGTNPVGVSHLRDLVKLLEFFIPVVSHMSAPICF